MQTLKGSHLQPKGSGWPSSTPRCTGSRGDILTPWWRDGRRGPSESPALASRGSQGRAPSTTNGGGTCWKSWESPCPGKRLIGQRRFSAQHTGTFTASISLQMLQTFKHRKERSDTFKHALIRLYSGAISMQEGNLNATQQTIVYKRQTTLFIKLESAKAAQLWNFKLNWAHSKPEIVKFQKWIYNITIRDACPEWNKCNYQFYTV